MRYFLTRRVPPASRILLIESGPRELAERLLPRLRQAFGPGAVVDLLCCRDGRPTGLNEESAVWRVHESRGGGARWKLLKELRGRRHQIAAAIFADDPTMAPWKWATLAALPSKFLIVNENADFFWLDRGNLRPVSQLLRARSGFGQDSSVRALGRVLVLPFAFVFLLFYAGWIHARRALRLLFGGRRAARA